MTRTFQVDKIASAIDAAETRYPGVDVLSKADDKKNWSQEFSAALAKVFSEGLSKRSALASAVHGDKPWSHPAAARSELMCELAMLYTASFSSFRSKQPTFETRAAVEKAVADQGF
jgi:hypothetical protein